MEEPFADTSKNIWLFDLDDETYYTYDGLRKPEVTVELDLHTEQWISFFTIKSNRTACPKNWNFYYSLDGIGWEHYLSYQNGKKLLFLWLQSMFCSLL